MKQLSLEGASGRSTIVIGESLAALSSYTGQSRLAVVTDRTVGARYRHLLPPCPVIEIGAGEASKTLGTVETIYEWLLANEVDRSWVVAGVGGGVVCDVTGFAASTYLRGIDFGFVATTLLAQVDAGVGGKNGVNFKGYKNLVGTFSQPRFVLCDAGALRTLPAPELKNGLAECVKQAALGDGALFSYLESSWEAALALDTGAIERIVYDALSVKVGIVAMDEREKGERRKLNFGHTLGHAIEKVLGLRHGEAVSIGMAAAVRLSVRRGLLPVHDLERLEALLTRFDLPVSVEADPSLLVDAMRRDKKREGDTIHFVLLTAIGQATVMPVTIDELGRAIEDICTGRR